MIDLALPIDAMAQEDIVFRDEARDFLGRSVPADIKQSVSDGLPVSKEQQQRWQRILASRGWLAPGWPAEFGGCDWTPVQRFIFDEECLRADAPFVHPFGLFRVAPVIFTFGSDYQKQKYLPRILNVEDWWCQGYSEPQAGSDLGALSTSARRDGDDYVVDGRKIWTSGAHLADRMFALVRTEPGSRGSKGISFLLIDLRSKGVEIRPIMTIDGLVHFNEVTFDGVRVPILDRVGEEGNGWRCSKFLLGFERFQIAEVPQSTGLMSRLLANIADGIADGRVSEEDISLAAIDLLAHKQNCFRFLKHFQNEGVIGAEVSMLKIRGSEIRQRIMDLTLASLGSSALPYEANAWSRSEWPGSRGATAIIAHALYSRGSTIYGGSNEIQRDLMARQLLGGA